MKPTIRLVACLVTLLLIVAMWLTFAYLMKDTGMIGAVLGLGLIAVLLIGNWVTDLAVEPEPAERQFALAKEGEE
ncbi:hypothetical protein [Nonomuraea sp. NPDC049504]|uniref:hypothetical protein n=1 Tax=Nonomuraea sp. NPDC049504 TaxID=3154729 RepID=UPI003433ECC8